jgi:hypothetical protein
MAAEGTVPADQLDALSSWRPAALVLPVAYETHRLIETARQSSAGVANTEIDKAKTREEYISKRYENDSRGIIVNFLLNNFGPAITLIGALGAGLIALYGYF